MAKHMILGDKAYVYKRGRSRYWQCAAFIEGQNHRTSTKCESLAEARDFAEDWYLTLRGKLLRGELPTEKSFEEAAERFMHEYEVLTEGERNKRWVKDHYRRINMHLIPYFGKMPLSHINAGKVTPQLNTSMHISLAMTRTSHASICTKYFLRNSKLATLAGLMAGIMIGRSNIPAQSGSLSFGFTVQDAKDFWDMILLGHQITFSSCV